VILVRGWRDGGVGLPEHVREQDDVEMRIGKAPIVRMDLLAHDVEEFESPGRDLFDYYTPPKKTVAPPPPPPKPKPERERPLPGPPAAPPRPAVVGPPKPSFNYLGFLGPKEARIAVFDTGKGSDLMLARIGDVLEDKFTLLEFKYEKVVIGYTDDRFKGQTAELEMSTR
jgi:hypothetical protein